MDGVGQHFHARHQGAVLICAGIRVAHEGRGDAVPERGGGGADQHELAAEFFGRHASGEHIGEAVGDGVERARGTDVVDGHAAAVQDLRGCGGDDRDGGRRGVEPDGARAEEQGVLQIGDAFLGRAVGDAHGLHGHGTVRAAVIVGQANCHLAHNAVQFRLRVDVAHAGRGTFDGRQGLQPARRSAVHRGIGELRGHHDVPRTADGARQGVVVFGGSGVGEEDVERDHPGAGGGQRVDGAGDDLARPRKAAEADHAGFVDGDDGDVFGNGKRAAGAHQPVAGIAADSGRLPIDQDAGRRGSQNDGQTPGDLHGSCPSGRHSATFSLLSRVKRTASDSLSARL